MISLNNKVSILFTYYLLALILLDGFGRHQLIWYVAFFLITGAYFYFYFIAKREREYLFISYILLVFYIFYCNTFQIPKAEIPWLGIILQLFAVGSVSLVWAAFKNRSDLYMMGILSLSFILMYYYYKSFTLGVVPILLFALVVTGNWRYEIFSIVDSRYSKLFMNILIILFIYSLVKVFLFSSHPASSINSYAELILFAVVFLYYISEKHNIKKDFMIVMFFLFAVAEIALFLSVIYEDYKILFSLSEFLKPSFKINFLMINVNYHAAILVIWLPVLFAYLFRKNKLWKRLGLIILFCLSIFNLMQLNARAANVSIAISLVLFLVGYFLPRKYIIFKIIIVFALIVFSIIAIELLLPAILKIASIQERIYIWKIYIRSTMDFALWTGFGPGASLINLSLPYDNLEGIKPEFHLRGGIHSHNIFLQIFHSWGLLGFLIFSALVIMIIYRTLTLFVAGKKPLTVAVISGFSIFSLMDYAIDIPFVSWSLIPFLAEIAYPHDKKKAGNLLIERWADSFKYAKLRYWPVLLFYLILGLYSLNFLIFKNEAIIFKKNIRLNYFENIELKLDGKINSNEVQKFLFWEQFSFINFFDYKKDQFEGEVFQELYTQFGEEKYLLKSLAKYHECILKNKFATFCYYGLAIVARENNDIQNSELYFLEAKKLDPFRVLPENH